MSPVRNRDDGALPAWGPVWTHSLLRWPELLVRDARWDDLRGQIREELGIPAKAVWVATGHQPWPFHPGIVAKLLALEQAVERFGWWGSFHLQTHAPVGEFAYPVWRGRLAFVQPFPGVDLPYDRWEAPLPLAAMRQGARDLLEALELPERFAVVETNLARFPQEGPLAFRILEAFLSWWGTPSWTLLSTRKIFSTDAFLLFFQRITQEPRVLVDRIQRALVDYRKRHRIRTRAQPFRDLEVSGPWMELPFWWLDDGGRHTLWIHETTGELRAGGKIVGHREDPDLRGKIFPKALMLTFFYRYVAVDFFVHGWGGLHYDAITDALAREMGFVPRPRVAVSLSLGLAWMDCHALERERREIEDELRHLRFRPERYLPENHPLRIRKAELIQAFSDPRADRPALHREMKALNEAMLNEPEIQRRKATLVQALEALQARVKRCQLLTYREYPFYFFTQEEIRDAFSGPDPG